MTAGHDQHSGKESSVSTWPAGWAYQVPAMMPAASASDPSRTHNTGRKIPGLENIAEIGHGVQYVRVGSAMMFPWRSCLGCAGPW
jgi:hypothetical protein